MRVLTTTVGTILGILAAASIGAGRGANRAFAAPAASAPATSSTAGSYTRYTHRLEDEATRILTPEIGGATKTTLASHGLDLWGASSIGEWRQSVLRWAPTTEKALTVLVRRTEVLWAEERVDEPYGSTILQLGSVHAMQKGLVRVLDALGVASPAPVSAHGIGAGTPAHLPAPEPTRPPETSNAYTLAPTPAERPAPTPAPVTVAPRAAPVVAPVVAPAPAALPRPTAARSTPPTAAPRRAPAPAAAAPSKNIAPAQSPYELAAYQGALAKESYRVLFPEIENGAQAALASRRNEMRNAPTVAEWKRLLADANPAFAKAAAVLERRAEVLRGDAKVLDLYESPQTQRAAVYGLQAGLEKILALYGK
jgi:hypothetical protein